MTRLPLAPHHLRCRDGRIISILDPTRRLDPNVEDEAYIVDPGVRLRAVPEDPAVEASGLARYWRHHNRREGNDALYAGVPVEVVRAFIRAHGGFAEAGEEALAEMKRAGEAEKPAPAPAEPSPSSAPEASAPAPEVAPERPFLLGEPTWPGGPRPRLTWGHWINMSWSQLRDCSSTR
ncbi:hypothetical protein [Methylorubrum sp. DB1722]|uniref:hypothetical protein n=1 Tax=Methylorubrum sp. DB1722 TaxID=2478916 RepID=UPI0018E3BCF8|nr:hypothetical protein [Methylorubrum sp. DB1722]MBI1689548.1 hypothetical protein [Methylorubrum sp. DB1722]